MAAISAALLSAALVLLLSCPGLAAEKVKGGTAAKTDDKSVPAPESEQAPVRRKFAFEAVLASTTVQAAEQKPVLEATAGRIAAEEGKAQALTTHKGLYKGPKDTPNNVNPGGAGASSRPGAGTEPGEEGSSSGSSSSGGSASGKTAITPNTP